MKCYNNIWFVLRRFSEAVRGHDVLVGIKRVGGTLIENHDLIKSAPFKSIADWKFFLSFAGW